MTIVIELRFMASCNVYLLPVPESKTMGPEADAPFLVQSTPSTKCVVLLFFNLMIMGFLA